MLTKQQVDTVSTMYRLAEKFEVLAAEKTAEKQIRDDAERAATHKRITEQIVRLAVALARKRWRKWLAEGRLGRGVRDEDIEEMGGTGAVG